MSRFVCGADCNKCQCFIAKHIAGDDAEKYAELIPDCSESCG